MVDCLGICWSGTGPFWGLSLGEPALLEIATDLMEEGCEDEEAVADFATGIGGVLAMAIRRSERERQIAGGGGWVRDGKCDSDKQQQQQRQQPDGVS